MPCNPKTFAISWASEIVATVPWVTAILANSEGGNIELSICTCESIKPGII